MKCYSCDVTLKQTDATKHIRAYWQCPKCGGRWYPGLVRTSDAEKIWEDEQRYKKSMVKPGSGGGSSGRKREQKKKKADVYTEC